jgi:hypothetical protein
MAAMRFEMGEGHKQCKLLIEDGPAAGTYAFGAEDNLLDGKILSLGEQEIGGRWLHLKVDLEKNLPELLAIFRRRDAERRARIERQREADEAQAAIDRKMMREGFSSGYGVIDRENKFNPNKF